MMVGQMNYLLYLKLNKHQKEVELLDNDKKKKYLKYIYIYN